MLRFNPAPPTVFENDLILDEEDCQALWYTPEEMEILEQSCMKVLKRLIKKKKILTKETRDEMIDLYERCGKPEGIKLTSAQKMKMMSFYLCSDDVVGLEFIIMGKHEDRTDRRAKLLKGVQLIQSKTEKELLGFDRDLLIRKKCLRVTHVPRRFAMHMGMARTAAAIVSGSANGENVPERLTGSNSPDVSSSPVASDCSDNEQPSLRQDQREPKEIAVSPQMKALQQASRRGLDRSKSIRLINTNQEDLLQDTSRGGLDKFKAINFDEKESMKQMEAPPQLSLMDLAPTIVASANGKVPMDAPQLSLMDFSSTASLSSVSSSSSSSSSTEDAFLQDASTKELMDSLLETASLYDLSGEMESFLRHYPQQLTA